MDISMLTSPEVVVALITTCFLTMFLGFPIFMRFEQRDERKAKEDEEKEDDKPTQPRSVSAIFEAPSSWADPEFVAKYEQSRCGDAPASVSGPVPAACAELVRKRRSVFPKDFEFDGSKVNIEYIEEALAAANWAPTHGKTEPWRFVVCGPDAIENIMDIRHEFTVDKLTKEDNDEKLEAHNTKMMKKRKQLRNCSAIIFIVVKRVAKKNGKYMPEWEEIAATSCAVQNLHLHLTSHWADGVGGYWSSGGYFDWLQSPALCELLGARDGSADGAPGRDLVLGGFYLGVCAPEKMDKYRAKRGNIAEKVTWLY